MMVLAPAIAYLAMHGLANGFPPFAKNVLAGLGMVPLRARPVAGATLIPLGAPMMLAAFALVLRAAMESCAAAPARDTAPRPGLNPG